MKFHSGLSAAFLSRMPFLLAALLVPKASAQSNEIVFTQSSSVQTSTASDPLAPGKDTYHLHGVVLDAHTGKPIARALVEAFGDRIAALTDRDGRFVLEVHFTNSGMAQGARTSNLVRQMIFPNITARKPGYTTNFSARRMQMVQTSDLDKDIVLKLTPESAIQGRVAASGDDYPENVRIHLFARQMQDGFARWQQVAQASTNSRGEYRFGGLAPGEYKLLTQEWSDQPGQSFEADRPTLRYAPVYYPAGSTATSGPDIHLSAGEVVPVNLNLHAETFYPVRIPVALPTNGNAGVQVRVNSDGGASGYSMRYNGREKRLEGLLPAGAYQVTLQSNGQEAAAATVSLSVHGITETAPVTLVPLVSIPVVVHQDFTGNEPPSVNNRPPVGVTLVPEEAGNPTPNLNPFGNDKQDLVLEHVLPGTYRAQFFAQRGYVAAATCGGMNLLNVPLTVNPGSTVPPIEITLRDDTGTIRGSLDSSLLSSSEEGQSLFVLILPSDSTSQRVSETIARPDGTFIMPNVAPGSYQVYASPGPLMNADYRSEAFLKRNGSKGASITVQPGETANVTLTSMVEEEP